MPRKATGSARLRNGTWYVRVTLGPGQRPPFALPTCSTEELALARCEVLSSIASKLRMAGQLEYAKPFLDKAASRDGQALDDVVKAVERLCSERTIRTGALSGGTTFKDFAEKWTKGELTKTWPDHVKEKRSVDDDRYRLERLYDTIGAVPLARFTLDDADRAMQALPEGLSPASRRHYAQLMHRVLSMAVFPARIIPANPLPRGFLPNAKSNKALTYLYPAEDAQLLACADVPLCYRVLYGFLAREGMRTGEAERLRWSDITWTEDGIAALTLDENKTDSPRAWTLSPGVSAALEAWRELTSAAEEEDMVFLDEFGRPVNTERLAEIFRNHLGSDFAKLERKQLFETSKNRRRIRAHDLRATFITIALANGRSETWVMDRTGHETSAMLARYRRASRSVAELGLGDLMPLASAIPELAAVPSKRDRKGTKLRARTDSNGRPPDSKSDALSS